MNVMWQERSAVFNANDLRRRVLPSKDGKENKLFHFMIQTCVKRGHTSVCVRMYLDGPEDWTPPIIDQAIGGPFLFNRKLCCLDCVLQEAIITPVSSDVLYLFRVQAVCLNDKRSDFSQSMLFRGTPGYTHIENCFIKVVVFRALFTFFICFYTANTTRIFEGTRIVKTGMVSFVQQVAAPVALNVHTTTFEALKHCITNVLLLSH